MHLQQAEEVKVQCQEIRLSAPVEQQQQAIKKLTSPQNPPRESRAFPSCSETWLDNMNSFEDVLAEEANFTPSHQPKHVTFRETLRGM